MTIYFFLPYWLITLLKVNSWKFQRILFILQEVTTKIVIICLVKASIHAIFIRKVKFRWGLSILMIWQIIKAKYSYKTSMTISNVHNQPGNHKPFLTGFLSSKQYTTAVDCILNLLFEHFFSDLSRFTLMSYFYGLLNVLFLWSSPCEYS